MIIETIVSTIAIEGFRPYLKRLFKRKNNRELIAQYKADMPVFLTVGELREVLKAFADDTPIMGGSFQYANLQIIDWIDGEGRICIQSTSDRKSK